MSVIPADASVAANTPLVPLLARREALVRFPFTTGYLDRSGLPQEVDWIAVDLSSSSTTASRFEATGSSCATPPLAGGPSRQPSGAGHQRRRGGAATQRHAAC